MASFALLGAPSRLLLRPAEPASLHCHTTASLLRPASALLSGSAQHKPLLVAHAQGSAQEEGAPSSAPPPPPPRRSLKKRSKSSLALAAAAGVQRVKPPLQAEQQQEQQQASNPPPPPIANAAGLGSAQGGPSSSPSSSSEEADVEYGTYHSWGLDSSGQGGCDRGERGGGVNQPCVIPKPIMILSDCTGESAARTVKAALSQFEACFDTSAPATIVVSRFLEDEQRAFQLVEQAAKQDALLVYTLVAPNVLKAVQTACKLYRVRNVDLWSNLLDHMEEHLESSRSGIPMTQHMPRHQLTVDYFKMIEAVEYTRKMDDGSHPEEWKYADLMIVGVSRSGKTPLCIYLGQRGYKVANLPLVPGIPPPKELYELDQSRVVGLTIDPSVLLSIRRNRVGMMGMKEFSVPLNYAGMKEIQQELNYARELYAAHPEWPVLDVTFRGVEETAARILKILNDKRGDSSPQWVEEMYVGMQTSMSSGSSHVQSEPMVAEQIYAGGEQCLVEGLY